MTAPPLSFPSMKALKGHIDQESIAFADLCFTGIRGRLRHATVAPEALPEDGAFAPPGWEGPALTPDLSCVVHDPFAAQPTVKILCTAAPQESDPRAALMNARSDLQIGVLLCFTLCDTTDALDGEVGALAETPTDAMADIRGEIVSVARAMGVAATHHYHPGGAPGACAVGLAPAGALRAADGIQLARYVAANVAGSYGRNIDFGGSGALRLLHAGSEQRADGSCNPYRTLLDLVTGGAP